MQKNLRWFLYKTGEEKLPYKFANTLTKRENILVGDYALIKDEKIIAIAEKKTLWIISFIR